MPKLYMRDIQSFNFIDDLEMLKFITNHRKINLQTRVNKFNDNVIIHFVLTSISIV